MTISIVNIYIRKKEIRTNLEKNNKCNQNISFTVGQIVIFLFCWTKFKLYSFN